MANSLCVRSLASEVSHQLRPALPLFIPCLVKLAGLSPGPGSWFPAWFRRARNAAKGLLDQFPNPAPHLFLVEILVPAHKTTTSDARSAARALAFLSELGTLYPTRTSRPDVARARHKWPPDGRHQQGRESASLGSIMRAGHQVASVVLAGLRVATVERVILDLRHVVETKPMPHGRGHRILIAVGILSCAGHVVDDSPVPVIHRTLEVRMFPVSKLTAFSVDDLWCQMIARRTGSFIEFSESLRPSSRGMDGCVRQDGARGVARFQLGASLSGTE